MAFLCACVTLIISLHMYKILFRPEVIRRVELCFFRPCKTSILASDVSFCLYKPCAMCLSGLHFQPCAGSEPDCNCCLSKKYTDMQLRSPEVTRVNFHITYLRACPQTGRKWTSSKAVQQATSALRHQDVVGNIQHGNVSNSMQL